jgi:RNA polymerase sigma-70 factor (ECF subfamily)
MDSDELIQKVAEAQAGDADAFRRLVEQHRRMVFGICHRLTDDWHDAEELAHESLVEAYIKLYTLRHPEKFAAWLRTLTLNICRGWYRQRKRDRIGEWQDSLLEEPASDETSYAHMYAGLNQLSAPHRLALVLHYLEGLSYQETAAFLDVPEGTVMSRLHRARKKLKRQVEKLRDVEEIPMVDEEQFSEEVDAEIALLLQMFGEEPNGMERLSVILKRSPQRIGRLLSEPIDAATLENLAILLPRLGAPAMGILLDLCFDAEPRTRVNVLAVIRELVLRCRSECRGIAAPLGVGLGDMPSFDAYLLLDQAIRHIQHGRPVADLLIELLQVADDAPTGQLLGEMMLCLGDSTHKLLTGRFWQIDSIEEVYRRSNYIVQTLRNRGTKFLEELTAEFRTPSAKAGLALSGMDMHTVRSWSFRHRNGRPAVPGARFISESRDPELVALVELDGNTIVEAAAEAARFLSNEDTELRDTAIRVLLRLHGREHIDAIRACLQHPVTSTRIGAIQALAGLEDQDSADTIMALAQGGDAGQRRAAIATLGRLGISEARQLLIAITAEEDATVVKTALIALGELGRDEAAPLLKQFLSASNKSLRQAAASALYGMDREIEHPRITKSKPHYPGEPLTDPNAQRVHHICADAAIRILPEIRSYDDREITERISLVCGDWATTRRKLIEHRLMHRSEGIYQFTELGAAVWRVEHFIMAHYLRG